MAAASARVQPKSTFAVGSKRTLVLVDGLRWVNGTSASGIPRRSHTTPSNMIERIEVLQAGASPL
jgi:iron complex outermembrane receptor protein